MIEETAAPQGIKNMASFRSNLRQLMLNKSAKLGKPLSQKALSKTTGVSTATVQRWFDPDYTFDRVDADTVRALTKFFNCKMDDLIEIVD
jgi:DNA-binding Xre family transcriptional regulator